MIDAKEASTPELLKLSFNPESYFKPIKSLKIADAAASSRQTKKVNFVKSKTTTSLQPSAFAFAANNTNKYAVKDHLLEDLNLDVYNTDVSMTILNNSNSNKPDFDFHLKQKHELDALYMEKSLLLNKISPSKKN